MNPNEMSEEEQIEYVSKNGNVIRHIKDPSEAVQLAAVRKYGTAIKYIPNPSEAVQLAAVQKYGLAISYIPNPSESVQIAAVNQDGLVIQWILDKGIRPSNKVIFAALTNPNMLDFNKKYYDELVKEIFPNNTLLAKKWIRYGDNHRC